MVEILRVKDVLSITYGLLLTIEESMLLSDVFRVMYTPSLIEVMTVVDEMSRLYQMSIQETIMLVDVVRLHMSLLVTEIITLDIQFLVNAQFVIVETVSMLDTYSHVGVFIRYLCDRMVITDAYQAVVPLAYSCEIVITTVGTIETLIQTVATIEKLVETVGTIEITIS